MGKTVRATEPLAFSLQIWPRAQLTQEEVEVSVTESILPILSSGKHPPAVIGTHTVQEPITGKYEERNYDTNLYLSIVFSGLCLQNNPAF